MNVKVKDIYDKVRSGEVTKWRFTEWLGMYGFKYKERGFNQGWKACEEDKKELTDEEIVAVYKDVFGWDVKTSDKNWVGLARALIKKLKD